jgi:hypothetical protein
LRCQSEALRRLPRHAPDPTRHFDAHRLLAQADRLQPLPESDVLAGPKSSIDS